MLGCTYGRLFRTTVAGGSYQEGLSLSIQGVPPGLLIQEEEIYADLLLRKPGQGELDSPRREPDIPIIYSGVNVSDTMEGFENKGYTNGTPFVLLIPNLDRHFQHIEEYRVTNRTPRPGHASYASYQKYGECDDAIGAGFFSGRYTATLVAAGAVAKRMLSEHGIEVFSYVKEAAGVRCPEVPTDKVREKVKNFKTMRRETDAVYKMVYDEGRITPDMRFLEKMAVLAGIEKNVPEISKEVQKYDPDAIREKYDVHPRMNCPDMDAANEMVEKILEVSAGGDSSGGVVEVAATGIPAGMGEPVFNKLDGELGRMCAIGAVKGVEVGAGFGCAKMTGSEFNDQMRAEGGRVKFDSNNAGGINGGLSTGQDIVARLAVKPTPTIAKTQKTIDKVTLENATLDAVTRRDPTIVARIWPVAEACTALILADQLMMHKGYRAVAGLDQDQS
mgnify:CR=1 FL=1